MDSPIKSSHLQWSKLSTLLLWSIPAVFLLFYLILSYHNRLASDDIYLLNELIEKGISNAIFDFEFSKRITSHMLFYSLFVVNTDLRSLHIQLFIYQLILILSFVVSLKYFFKHFLAHFFSCVMKSKELWLIACLATTALFFFTFQLTEVWFWTIASAVHLVPIIVTFALFGALMKEKSSIGQLIFILFCALFIGGGSETVTLTVLVFLGGWFILSLISPTEKSSNKLRLKLLIAVAGCSILFLLNILGAGTEVRIDLETVSDSSVYISTLFEFLKTFVEPRVLLFLCFLPIFYLLGVRFRNSGNQLSTSLRKRILISSMILLASLICTFAPLLFVFDSLGPPRGWSPFGITLGLLLIANAFLSGNASKRNLSNGLIIFPALVASSLIGVYIVRQTPSVTAYSAAYDTRTEELLRLQEEGRKEDFCVKPLPNSGMLVHSSLEPTIDGWNNKQLAKVLKLDFPIYGSAP